MLNRLLLPLLLAVCIARLWLMPMGSSLWLDETATVFVARNGANHPSLAAAAPQAWKSIYYPVARVFESLFGFSEVSYRIPSVLAMAGAVFLVARLAARLIHPGAAWFAVFACLAVSRVNYCAADARPYALGMLAIAASLILLVHWLDTGGWRWGIGFVGCAALLWQVHLLFWPGYLVFGAYTLARKTRGETPVSWARIGTVFVALGLALTPVLLDAIALHREARAHVIAPPPSWRSLAGALQLNVIAACGGGAWVLKQWRQWPPCPVPQRSAQVLIAAWWLCQPVCLFAYSRITGTTVFLPRYVSLSLPGAALAAVAAAAFWVPASQWKRLAVVVAAGVLTVQGHWSQLWPRHHNSDWRAAARVVNQAAVDPRTPVVCPSPYVEAVPPVWRADYPLPGLLYSHLAVYPVRGQTVLFPFANSAQTDSTVLQLSREILTKSDRFVVYGWEPQVHYWRDWFSAHAEFAGWRLQRLGPFADVDVWVFNAPSSEGRR